MSPNERRMEILQVLIERKEGTLENLAFEFGVSKRTIQYDIETLSLSHPIYCESGNGGGIRIEKDYQIGRKRFSSEQEEFLTSLLPRLSEEEKEKMNEILKMFSRRKKK